MKFRVDRFETVAGNVSIDLCGGNIGVAEKFLHYPEVRSPFQKVGGKGVAECVRGDFFGDPGKQGIFFNDLPDILPRETFSVFSEKKMICFGLQHGPHALKISPARLDRDAAERHKPLLVPFPAAFDEMVIKIDIFT